MPWRLFLKTNAMALFVLISDKKPLDAAFKNLYEYFYVVT